MKSNVNEKNNNLDEILSFDSYVNHYKKLKEEIAAFPFDNYINNIVQLIKTNAKTNSDEEKQQVISYKADLENYIKSYFYSMNDKMFKHSISLNEYKEYINSLKIIINNNISIINVNECLERLENANVKDDNTMEFYDYFKEVRDLKKR